MSHHSTVPAPHNDITDLYLFHHPDQPDRCTVILNVHPFAFPGASTFSPETSYEFKIDTDGDAEAEVAFHILFSAPTMGQQTARVYRVAGEAARGTGALGEMLLQDAPVSYDHEARVTAAGAYQFFAGLRSDPWFADVDGVFNNFQFTGKDTFAQVNILGIVLEMPTRALGPGSRVSVWARTVAYIDGEWGQVDQVGRPLVTAVFNPSADEQHHFVETPPAQQRAAYLPKFTAILEASGYAAAEAARIAQDLLPDMLPYDRALPAGYPNGRRLSDDLLDVTLALITHGRVTSDLVGPHRNLLDEFPYLGVPHAVAAT